MAETDIHRKLMMALIQTLEAWYADDPTVYEMLCAADTVGVFQVESRAQMATLPRMKKSAFTIWWSRWRSSGPGPSSARC